MSIVKRLPPIKLRDTLVTWSCKITWQTKTNISSLPQCIWALHLQGWRLTFRGSYHLVTWALIRWSYLDHVTVRKIVSPLSRDLWPLTLIGNWLWQGRVYSKHFFVSVTRQKYSILNWVLKLKLPKKNFVQINQAIIMCWKEN